MYKVDFEGSLVDTIDLAKYNTHPMLNTFTAYDWNRKYNYLLNDMQSQIEAKMFFVDSNDRITKETISIPTSSIAPKNWHMFTYTFKDGQMNLYMDAILRNSFKVTSDNRIYYEYENPLLLGADVGKNTPLSYEYDINSLLFKGRIDDFRIYGIALSNSDIRYLYLNKFNYHDLNWNMDTGNQNYLEEVARFFKFKLPGLKSQYYNIRISGLGINNIETRTLIESIIKTNLKKIVPAYAELFRIIWE